jgi:cytochrome c553
MPNRLYRTVGQGIYNRTAATSTTTYTYSSSSGTCVAGTSTQTAVGAFSLSPVSYGIVSLQNYGLGFTYNAGKTTSNLCTPDTGTVVPVAAGATREADSTTLVISPITTACFACHDGTLPRLHMETYGASIYKPRSVALGTVEQCLTCHGPGRIAAIADMHAK